MKIKKTSLDMITRVDEVVRNVAHPSWECHLTGNKTYEIHQPVDCKTQKCNAFNFKPKFSYGQNRPFPLQGWG